MNQRHTFESSAPKRNLLIRTGNFISNAGHSVFNLFKKENTYVEIICALMIILFIYTGVNKMMDIGKFTYEMGRSPFIQNMAGFISYTLPAGEILLSILLILNRTRLLALYLSFALMALFSGYIWLMLNYAYDLPCSCGGIISKLSWHQHLIFNSVFTGLCAVGALLQSNINKKRSIKTQRHST